MDLQPLAELRVPIKLDKERVMCFNVNTMVAYEQQTGKFFLDTVAKLYEAVYPNGLSKPPVGNGLEILKKVSMTDLRALLWASVHEYDEKDNPVWPLTMNQIGRYIDIRDLSNTFGAFIKGQSANSPSKTEMGESQAEAKQSLPVSSPPTTDGIGGDAGIELPEDAFA